jgi:3-deoxy-D-manno-octulosonic-acid transferase
MMRALYSLLMWLAQPLLRRKLRARGVQEPGYLHAMDERFGHYATPPWLADGRTVWLHSVSLGETRAAAVLLAQLRARWPDMRLLLTHGTATGRAEGARLLQAGDAQVWQPWDTPAAVRRFLKHFQPAIGILMETEVWPNLSAQCRAAGVPLVLANARLSDKSLRQARRLAWLARPAYRSLAAVWAQTEADAERLRQLGAPVRGVFGNLKFDAAPDAAQLAQGRAWRTALGRPVILFASSREGEEAELLALLQARRVADHWPAVQWLIVPRHPQRFDVVADLVRAHGFSLSRRSRWTMQPETADIWLGDSLGEMALYFGLSDAALLGGSFAPLGGQNLIEAAACGCPVLMGPHTFNFAQAAHLAETAGAARRVADLAQAVEAAQALTADAERQDAMAQAALSFAQAHRGAADKTATAVLALLRR